MVIEDAPSLARMTGSLFVCMDAPGKFVEEDCIRTFETFHHMEFIQVIVAEVGSNPVGMLVFTKSPSICNAQELVFQELFWWVEPEHRGSGTGQMLLAELQKRATDAGAARIAVTITKSPINENLGASLSRIGFKESETTHIKELR